MDNRWKKVADLLVNKSVHVKPGEKVMIAMVEPEAYDLAKCVYAAVIKAGAYPQVQMLSEEFKHSILRYGNNEQIARVPDMENWGMDWADVYIGLRGAHNLFEMYDIPNDKLAIHQKAMGVVSNNRWAKTRWILIRIPTDAFAVEAR